MTALDWKVVTGTLAVFGAVNFVACVIYGLIVPPEYHAPRVLEAILPGFRWLTPWSFLVGLVETFIYGAYVGLVFTPIYNFMLRACGSSTAGRPAAR